jgi:hypothetical protein
MQYSAIFLRSCLTTVTPFHIPIFNISEKMSDAINIGWHINDPKLMPYNSHTRST